MQHSSDQHGARFALVLLVTLAIALAGTQGRTATVVAQVGTLKVQYRADDSSATDTMLRPYFTIINTSGVSVPLSTLKIRYWYTRDGTQTQSLTCDYVVAGCGSLAAGVQTGAIQTRFNKSDWSNYSETDDYSFDPTKTAFADWSKVMLYRNGTLVWGTEP